MSRFDLVMRAFGITLMGSALTWLVTLGITFIVDDAQHVKAGVGWANSRAPWIVIPIIASVIWLIAGLITVVKDWPTK